MNSANTPDMTLRPLGRTGMHISPLSLGAMMLGRWGGTTEQDGIAVIHAALDAGINVVDTADVYSWGGSEEIVGQALKGRRESVVLTTKFHYPMDPDGSDPNRAGNSRRWIMREVEDSLRRLRTDYIDVYQVHRPDPYTDIEETLSAMSDLVRDGKVRVIGTSTFPAEELVEAQWVAERRGLVRFRTEQPPYSILNRSIEAAVLPTCERYGLGVLSWSPLSEGWLTGKYQEGEIDLSAGRQAAHRAQFDPELEGNLRKRAAVTRLRELADEAGCTLIELALGFVRSHPAITSVLLGPRNVDQLLDLVKRAAFQPDRDLLDRIDAIVPPGTALNPLDSHHVPPALRDPSLRRHGTTRG